MIRNIARVVLGLVALAFCIFSPGVNWTGNISSAASVSAAKGETVSGELEVVAECEEDKGRILYYLDTDSKEHLKINFRSELKRELKTGMRVTLRGSSRNGNEIAADEELMDVESSSTSANSFTDGITTSSIVAGTFGEIKVLVLLVNFQNNPTSQPYTTAQANNLMFNQANTSSVTNYYREASYGQTWVTGDSVGVFTLPMDGGTNACNNTSQVASLAKTAATNAGVNLANYNKFMYVFPSSGCSWSGQAYLSGQDAWINGSLVLRTTAHELGHTIGLYHAHSMNCSDVTTTGCVTNEYGHISDMEGQTGITGHFHPFQKERLGWLNYGASPPITTVTGAGRYTIGGLSIQDWSPKALKIQRNSTQWYYVEFRRPVGFDSFVANNSTTMNGVLITLDANGDSNYLLDMVPSTAGSSDSALTVGRSYTDSSTGMTITVVSVSSSGAVVDVSYGAIPCIMASPTVSVSPATVMSVPVGGSASYTVTVTNNNSSSCTGNSFNIQSAVPAGWSASTATPVLSVSPGSSASANVSLSVPAGQADGMYSAVLGAANASNGNFASSSARDLSVFSSISVTASTNQSSYTTSQTLVITSKVMAAGVPVAGASVKFSFGLAGAQAKTGTATTDSNGVATYSYRFNKKKDPVGTYYATELVSVNGMSGSGSTSFTVR